MIVVDANVLIAHFSSHDVHHTRADRMLAEMGDEVVLIHPITLAEVLVGPIRIGRLDRALNTIAALNIEQYSPSPDAAVRLAHLRVRTGLPLPDCCVLDAAMKNGAEVATFDSRLASATRDLGLTVATD